MKIFAVCQSGLGTSFYGRDEHQTSTCRSWSRCGRV